MAERDTTKEVADWAARTDNVRAVILSGSRTNPEAPVDFLSDYDIELFVLDLSPFLLGDEWLERFGTILVRWPHLPLDRGEGVTRLVLYEDVPRIDFQIKRAERLRDYVSSLPDFYDIGYEVLLDKDGLTDGLATPTHSAFRTRPPTEEEYEELTKHFWWNVTYVAKYLHRDELFFAKYMLDDGLHHKYLHTVISWYIGMKNEWNANPGAFGRWFKRHLKPEIWTEIELTFTGAGIEENWEATFKTIEVFRRLASLVGKHMGYEYPAELDQRVTSYLTSIRKLKAD
jgi:aminoglycoside 6-adenylyltransferase